MINVFKELSRFQAGDMVLFYWVDEETSIPGMTICPAGMEERFAVRREDINGHPTVNPLHKVFKEHFPAYSPENLVQLKLSGDPYPGSYAGGTTMRNSASSFLMKLEEQRVVRSGTEIHIVTMLRDIRGIGAEHHMILNEGSPYMESWTELENGSDQKIGIEMLSSFSLGGLSPFQKDEGTGNCFVHRFLSTWSAEGRHEVLPVEKMNLERSWNNHGARSFRFGQVGSMPVKGSFPFVALEDREAGVLWGAQISHPASWQLEVARKGDLLNISGGLADREFGHWMKALAPGERFKSPAAVLSCCRGDVQDLTGRMVRYQEEKEDVPASEKSLPILFNDWCTTWGDPSQENILKLAGRLEGSEVEYLVMDDGWFNDGSGCQKGIGDWNVSAPNYPRGLKSLTDTLREKGFLPGVWFEMECCTEGSDAFEQTEHMLHRDGYVLQCDNRRFWDFRDPWVHDYLYGKVIRMMKENGISYIKTDYNDTIGLGCDDEVSLGEGLRAHLEGVQAFYRRMRQEIPDLVIEVCSSGGHRLEPSWMNLASMGGFSDSHEGTDIPYIAANTQMMIPARKNQIWAVLREEDSLKRLRYSLAATFLGRMCLSGDIHTLSEEQMKVVRDATDLYRKVVPVIAEGESRRFGPELLSYTSPEGWQGVLRRARSGDAACAVIHGFGDAPSSLSFPLGESWEISDVFADDSLRISVGSGELKVSGLRDFEGLVVTLKPGD